MTTNEATNISPIEATIMYVRACYPVTQVGIQNHINAQCDNGCDAESVIRHGLSAGWLAVYDTDENGVASYTTVGNAETAR